MVEHDLDTMRAADCIVDVGPMAGQEGGEIIAVGSIDDLISAKRSITGRISLRGRKDSHPEKASNQ